MTVYHLKLGLYDYKQTWDLQKKIHLYKQKNRLEDIIITVEHPPVYTLGKTGSRNHVLIGDDEMKRSGISFFEIDRGGDITFHGPGQLVVYPVFDLNNYYKDTHRFLRDLEKTVIGALNEFGIRSTSDGEFTGVWAGEEKICAIGIKVSKWITMHGLALNVNNDLSYFGKIIPCGIFHKGVTSMSRILGRKIDMDDIISKMLLSFSNIFGIDRLENITLNKLSHLTEAAR
jgi:lipoate-protein ligase B